MLKGIDPCISPELLKLLAEMGHGEELLICDAHYPAHAHNPRVLRMDGLPAERLLAAILPLWELDSYSVPVIMMQAVAGDSLDPAVEQTYRQALDWSGSIERVERFAFYERSRQCSAIVVSGSRCKYGNIIIKKGLINPAGEF